MNIKSAIIIVVAAAWCLPVGYAVAMPIGPGATFKKKSDLEADGYICSALAGTSMTFCSKPGTAGSYSCDASGNCISNKTAPKPDPRLPTGNTSVQIKAN